MWRVFRPDLRGCLLYLTDRDGAVLLVRHSYGTGRWTLPGGGAKRGESAEAAARREAEEELGLRLDRLELVERIEENLHGAHNELHIFAAGIDRPPVIDQREIVAAAFFAPQNLPRELAERARRWIALGDAAQKRSS